MTIKKYSTVTAHTFLLMVKTADGRSVTCRFKGGSQPDSRGTCTVKDEAVQQAIEHCSLFGKEIILTSTVVREDAAPKAVEPEVKVEEAPAEIKDIQEFKSLVTCKAAMAEHGIDVAMIRTCAQAEEVAKANGLEYRIKR